LKIEGGGISNQSKIKTGELNLQSICSTSRRGYNVSIEIKVIKIKIKVMEIKVMEDESLKFINVN